MISFKKIMSDINKEVDEIFDISQNILDMVKLRSEKKDNRIDDGFVNDNGSMLLRDDGENSLVAGKYAQYRVTPDGNTIEISKQSNTTTVRKNLEADEIVINNHKLNPQLYELADMRMYNNIPFTAIGGLSLFSTVLVKVWEPTLEKWVLIRRLARVPAFSNTLNLPEVPEELDIDLELSEDILKMSEGYKNVE